MFRYKSSESHDGSHFFVKTPSDCIYQISLKKPDEEYLSEYFESHIRHLYIISATDSTIPHSEKIELLETISHIVYTFLTQNEAIVKVEIRANCGKDQSLNRYIAGSPPLIDAIAWSVEPENSLYFIFDTNNISFSDVLENIIDEYER